MAAVAAVAVVAAVAAVASVAAVAVLATVAVTALVTTVTQAWSNMCELGLEPYPVESLKVLDSNVLGYIFSLCNWVWYVLKTKFLGKVGAYPSGALNKASL